jgi:hypothetical protein
VAFIVATFIVVAVLVGLVSLKLKVFAWVREMNVWGWVGW